MLFLDVLLTEERRTSLKRNHLNARWRGSQPGSDPQRLHCGGGNNVQTECQVGKSCFVFCFFFVYEASRGSGLNLSRVFVDC